MLYTAAVTPPRYHPAEGLLATDLDHELVLLDPVSSRMYSLNGSGRLLWGALPLSADALAGVLAREYGLDPEQAQADADAWLRRMLERRLVVSE